jgi:hypothetical protein
LDTFFLGTAIDQILSKISDASRQNRAFIAKISRYGKPLLPTNGFLLR